MVNIDNTAVTSTNNNDRVIIEGITPLVCIFCKHIMCIEFDLDLHLYQNHRMELVMLPIVKGSLDLRIKYAIEEGRRVGTNLQALNKATKEKLGFEYSS